MYIKSYKSAFISVFVVLLVITVTAIAYNAYWRTSDAILGLSNQIIDEASEKIMDRAGFLFETSGHFLHINKGFVAQRDIVQDQDELLAMFWRQMRLKPAIVSVYAADTQGNFVQAREQPRLATRVIDRRGEAPVEQIVYRDQTYRPIAHVKGGARYDPRERPWYRKNAADSKVLITDIYLFSDTGKPGLTGTIPVMDDNGETDAVIGVDITLDSLSEFLAEQRIAGEGFAMIVDDRDRLIAFPYQLGLNAADDAGFHEGIPSVKDLADQWLVDAYRRASKVFGTDSSPAAKLEVVTSQTDGERYVAQMRDIDGEGEGSSQYRLFTVVPESALLSSAQRIRIESFVVSIIILLVAIIAVYALAARFTKPIEGLAENIDHMKELRLEEMRPVDSGFPEIQAMDASIRDMRHGLEVLQKYVPEDLVSSVMRSGEDVGLGGEVVDLTLFFSAISGFSNLSEHLPVEEVTEILNKHLDALSGIIRREKGTIDKYMGDSIMAFWGAPMARTDGPERACRAALLCHRADLELDRELMDAGKPTADNVFAIHCGEAIVGNIGSSVRRSYTAMGASVETARMLRYQNYHYGTSILISDATYQHVEGLFSCRRLDVVRLRDDWEPLTLYELLGKRDAPLVPATIDYITRYESAFSQYQQGEWEEALASFRDLSLERPEDKAAHLMVSRLQKSRPVRGKGRRPPKDWDGSAPASW